MKGYLHRVLVAWDQNLNVLFGITRRYVKELAAHSSDLISAILAHWPASKGRVVDDLLTRKRTGNF